MSEYQYYEFVAVDRPLTAAQQSELRGFSTRARITSSSFVNDYQWGDLKGDPRVWMERYFDAFLYLANWGTRRIALRLPLAVLDAATAADYCVGDSAHAWATRTHVILDLSTEDEDGDDEWWEDEGRLASIVPVRAELAAGDRRLLYLAWLLRVQGRQLSDEEPEPPVPAGLGELSGPLAALADFLRLDPDLLAVAARASAPLAVKPPATAALRRWVGALPEAEKDEVVLRLLRGEDAHLRVDLLRASTGRPTSRRAVAEPWVRCSRRRRSCGRGGSGRFGSGRRPDACAASRRLPPPAGSGSTRLPAVRMRHGGRWPRSSKRGSRRSTTPLSRCFATSKHCANATALQRRSPRGYGGYARNMPASRACWTDSIGPASADLPVGGQVTGHRR